MCLRGPGTILRLFKQHWSINLTELGLSCRRWAFFCGMCDLVPWPGIQPGFSASGHSVLATGPPGKSNLEAFKKGFWELQPLINVGCGAEVKASACNVGDLGSIPGLGRSPGKGNGKPTPVFLPGEFHGWRSLVGYSPRVAKSWTRLSDFTFTFTFDNKSNHVHLMQQNQTWDIETQVYRIQRLYLNYCI